MLDELRKQQYKKQLETLLQRKAKADALPIEERQKWQKEYENLLREIAKLKQLLGEENFDLHTALKQLISTLRDLSIRINYAEVYPYTAEFFKAYPNLESKLVKAWEKVEYGLKHRIKNEFENGLKEVCESFELIAQKMREEKEYNFNFYVYEETEKIPKEILKPRQEKITEIVEETLSD